MEVTTLTPRLSAKLSTSAPLTEPVVWPSTASSAPTGLSSTRTTSSATGGSTSTAPGPRVSTASTTSTLPRGPLWTELPATLSRATPPPMLLLILDTPPLLNIQELKVLPSVQDVRDLLPVEEEGDRYCCYYLVNATTSRVPSLCFLFHFWLFHTFLSIYSYLTFVIRVQFP